jgi:hypothetical protein
VPLDAWHLEFHIVEHHSSVMQRRRTSRPSRAKLDAAIAARAAASALRRRSDARHPYGALASVLSKADLDLVHALVDDAVREVVARYPKARPGRYRR